MMGLRARVIALLFGVALAGALSACVTHEEPAAPAAAPVVAAAQCYWLSNEGAGWVARPDLSEAELCFEMDSCSGGVGLSGGGCYKWAIGAEAPAIPWSELGFQPLSRAEPAAASQSPTPPANPQLAADIPPPEDIYQGDFERTSDCENAACTPPSARMRIGTPIYARADRSSPRVGDVAASECVRPEDYRILDTPHRGVVLAPYGPFAAGDVIYRLAYAGEGNTIIGGGANSYMSPTPARRCAGTNHQVRPIPESASGWSLRAPTACAAGRRRRILPSMDANLRAGDAHALGRLAAEISDLTHSSRAFYPAPPRCAGAAHSI